MDFIAEDYESLPILLALGLANDPQGEEWSVILEDKDGNVIAEGVILPDTNWEQAVIWPAYGTEITERDGVPLTALTIPWDTVATIRC